VAEELMMSVSRHTAEYKPHTGAASIWAELQQGPAPLARVHQSSECGARAVAEWAAQTCVCRSNRAGAHLRLLASAMSPG